VYHTIWLFQEIIASLIFYGLKDFRFQFCKGARVALPAIAKNLSITSKFDGDRHRIHRIERMEIRSGKYSLLDQHKIRKYPVTSTDWIN
jgi:hypothetical protein